MSITLERAIGSAIGATVVVLFGWGVAWIVGLGDPALPTNLAIALFIGSSLWFAVSHDFAAASFTECLFESVGKRSIQLAFGFLNGLILLWIVARLVAEWSIEPSIRDYGECFRFSDGLCGEVDLNAEKRDRAAYFVNNISATLFLFSPMLLLFHRIRNRLT